ncbi:MAG: hypothetical protein IJW51_04195 [Clostridia bacterium]|nr:hypothetical protein [Clostridia bacterium]
MADKKQKPANGMENSGIGVAMLGNFKPAEKDRATREIALADFEPTNKRQTNEDQN